jgi:hypothetical protein
MHIWWSLMMVLGVTLLYPSRGPGAEAVKLPPPVQMGGMSLAAALEVRRTVRRFASRLLDLAQAVKLPPAHESPLVLPVGYKL